MDGGDGVTSLEIYYLRVSMPTWCLNTDNPGAFGGKDGKNMMKVSLESQLPGMVR